MIKRNIVRTILASTALAGGCLAAPAWAQSPHPNRDGNGVDLTTGEFNLQLPIASIGSGQAALTLVAYSGATDNWTGVYATFTGSSAVIVLGDQGDRFVMTGGVAKSANGTGATFDGTTYRTLSGTTIVFSGNSDPDHVTNLCGGTVTTDCTKLAQTISGKSGLDVTFNWDIHSNCSTVYNPDFTLDCTDSFRLASVSNDAGYSINWTFATNSVGPHSNPAPDWFRRATAQFQNANASSSSWPTVTYANPSSNVTTITTPASETWRITTTGGLVTGVRRPTASSSDTTTISYSSGKVNSVTNNGITTGYAYSVSGSTATMVVTDALSNSTTIVSDLTKFRPTSITNAVPKTTSMTYDSAGRPTEVTAPETNKVQYGYDTNGNLITTTVKAKSSSTLSDIVTTAEYDTTCTTVATCNTLTWSKDALGNKTEYAYDGTTGLLTAVTAPAATGGAKRAQTRYSYSTVAGVSVVTGVSTCATGATTDTPSCVGTADETKTTVSYDSNLNVTSVSNGAGDASLTATTAATYDAVGNLVTVDGPLSGTADTTMFRYDADRRRIGVIAPDPDASGALKRRAVRTTYNADGQPTVTELGTVDSLSDSDWSAFTSLQQVTATYDNAYRIRDVSTASGTTYGVTDYSYDPDGRIECTAARLNPSQWGTLTTACTAQTAGSDGPDRIAKTGYDTVGRVTKVQSAFGITGVQADEATTTYTDNGLVATATDAENNKTSYTYDGVDRLSKTIYPSTTKGAGTSNTGDFELLTYDAASNVTNRQLRDGTSIAYTYDALNRAITKNLPGSELDVTYGYDLLSRPLTAATSAQTVTLAYDALGRLKSQTTGTGTVGYQYDLAGRRTQMTWPDTFYVTYDYDPTGNLKTIKESGSTTLATFDYDSVGRRTTLTRGNGVATTYTYDNASRLTQLYANPASTAYDLTLDYSYNNAGQIKRRTASNDAYGWTRATNVTDAFTANGLNQMLIGTTLAYDARGNLNASGSDSYSYSSENLLTSGTVGGVTTPLTYDPLLRLYQIGTTGGMKLVYDGTNIVGQSNGTTLGRRYVTVPGSDEVLVEYKVSSGTKDYKLIDERGSVIAVTDASGNGSAINSYDEYGIPGSNAGRFQYTGQFFISELGLQYSKARMYAPGLGRFMQTDPIGYGDGMNWYNYVKGDPVNRSDPSGLCNITEWDDADDNHHISNNCFDSDDLFGLFAILGRNSLGTGSSGGFRGIGGLAVPPQCPNSSTGIRGPDFIEVSVSVPIPNPITGPFLGLGFSLTADRYGNDYLSINGVAGFPTAGGGSSMAGWMNKSAMPSESALKNMLSGWGGGASGGFIAGGGFYGNSSGTATKVGVTTPGVQAFGGYTFDLGKNTPQICQ